MKSKKTILSLALASLMVLNISNAKALDKKVYPKIDYYKVNKGDTFIKLSERYFQDGSLYNKLAKFNGRESTDYIYIGEILRIPEKQMLLGNIDDLDQYGCTEIDFNNKEDLNWKYYKMKESDTFNGSYYKIYKEMFEKKPEVTNEFKHKDLRTALYIWNNITDDENMQIGSKIYLMDYDQLIRYTRELKRTNKLIKTR